MAEIKKEPIPYEDNYRVLGVELDDGTFLKNHSTEVQVDDGTPFTIEFFPGPHDSKEYDVFGRGELTLITPSKLQRWFDEGRAEITSK